MNLEKAKEEFLKYTEKYDLEIESLKRKQLHSLRVMEISKQIAEGIGLSEEEIELATLIGLLHDIARFEQFTQYKTFNDSKSFDHGDFGAEILKKEGFNEIVFKAVRNHNKYEIEKGLTDKEKIFAKIIRDADKIDIFYEEAELFWKGQEEIVENSILSKEIIDEFCKFVQVKNREERTPIDDIIKIFSFIFDINYKVSFEIIEKNDYINKILNRYCIKDKYTREKVEEIRDVANKHIKAKTEPTPNGQVAKTEPTPNGQNVNC